MVAIIKTGHSVQRILNYNENKVNEQVAKLIAAGNFPIDPQEMSFKAKLNFLNAQNALNENVTRNSVHISLNFHHSESSFPAEKLTEIAQEYMQGIGFGQQPYLVYQHNDAGHPHIHIVSIKVRADGSRIDMNNIGRNQSEQARKSIEEKYLLVKADDQQKIAVDGLPEKVIVGKIDYGRVQTKRAIQNVLEAVIDNYKFASLPELNAVLQLYNVRADSGTDGSRIWKNDGLTYHILDGNGNSIGVPIKASAFYSSPTLKNLREKFDINRRRKGKLDTNVKNAVDAILLNKKLSMSELVAELKKVGIDVIQRRNENGFLFGISYVDHRSKCVFNGSFLGKQYAAKGLQQRVVQTREEKTVQTQQRSHGIVDLLAKDADYRPLRSDSVVDILTNIEYSSPFLPKELKRKKKRKKK